MFADFTDIRCSGKSEIQAVDGLHFEFQLLEDNGTLVEISGETAAVYRHIRG